MYCAKCGYKIRGGERFCGKCGTPRKGMEPAAPVQVKSAPTVKKKSPKAAIIVVAVVLALIAIGVFVYLHFFTYRSVKVEEYDGNVELERKGSEKDLFDGLKLIPKDVVTTGEEGFIELFIDSDKHVVAEENTCFSINAVGNENSGKVTIDLEYGSTLITIDEKLAENSEFEVETPNCLCSVRGTTFHVSYDEPNLTTRVDVTEGTVRVKAGDIKLDVNAGESVVIKDKTVYKVRKENGTETLELYTGDDGNSAETPELYNDADDTGTHSVIGRTDDTGTHSVIGRIDENSDSRTSDDSDTDVFDENSGETGGNTGNGPEEISTAEVLSDLSALFGEWRPVVPENYDTDPTYQEYVDGSLYCFYSDGKGYKAYNFGSISPSDAFSWTVAGTSGAMIYIDVAYDSVEVVKHYTYDGARSILTIEGYDYYRYSETISYDFFAENSYEATPDMVIGTWLNQGNYAEYTFNADGTGVMTNTIGTSRAFTWEINDGKFTCSESGIRVFDGHLQGQYYGWVNLKRK